jgi:hypothetical protein
MDFVALLVSSLLLVLFSRGILPSPCDLAVATLFPLGISLGLMNQLQPRYEKVCSWFLASSYCSSAQSPFPRSRSRCYSGSPWSSPMVPGKINSGK